MSASFAERQPLAASPSDDGCSLPNSLSVPARPASLPLIGAMVQWHGRRAGLDSQRCGDLEVAVDEACTNVIRHAFSPEDAREMTILCEPVAEGLRVTITNQGRPFDPAEAAETGRAKHLQDPASGGMGLLLMRRLTDAMDYRFSTQEGNQLTLIKRK